MKKLVIIDTFNFLHRAYYAIPKSFRAPDNTPTNAVYGVCSMIISLTNEIKPDYMIAALDSKKPTFRVEEFSNYKAQRKEMDEELKVQIPLVFDAIEKMGILKVNCEGYEADDVIGTLVERHKKDFEIFILSNDRDLWQLISDNVKVMLPNTKGTFEEVNNENVKSRLEFDKHYLVDYKALRGDTADNIPGVYGIGEVTAKKLISEYQTVENIYSHIDEIKPDSLKKKLIENVEMAYTSKKLATIILDCPLVVDIEAAKLMPGVSPELVVLFEKLNFKSLLRRLNVPEKKQEVSDLQINLF
jgi:DNA polymerase-1